MNFEYITLNICRRSTCSILAEGSGKKTKRRPKSEGLPKKEDRREYKIMIVMVWLLIEYKRISSKQRLVARSAR